MTEDEAKTKWCPFARTAYIAINKDTGQAIAAISVNRGLDLQPSERACCIASACMAWRWTDQYTDTRTGTTATLGSYPPGVLDGTGFCGLAGAPQ